MHTCHIVIANFGTRSLVLPQGISAESRIQ